MTYLSYLTREIPASEKTALQAVMDADQERTKLEALAEMLACQTDDDSQEYLMQVSNLSNVGLLKSNFINFEPECILQLRIRVEDPL